MKNIIQTDCKSENIMSNFHSLNHLKEVVERFGSINILSASHFKPYNFHINNAYQSRSQRPQRRMEITLNVLETTNSTENRAYIPSSVVSAKQYCRRGT